MPYDSWTRKPLPRPTSLTQEYWDAASEGILLFARCADCGRAQFPREFACVNCRSLDVSWVKGGGRGTAYSYAILHRAPFPGFPVPFFLAIVELDEGYNIFSGIVGCPAEQLACDMRVQVIFEPQPGGLSLPMFRPTTDD